MRTPVKGCSGCVYIDTAGARYTVPRGTETLPRPTGLLATCDRERCSMSTRGGPCV